MKGFGKPQQFISASRGNLEQNRKPSTGQGNGGEQKPRRSMKRERVCFVCKKRVPNIFEHYCERKGQD